MRRSLRDLSPLAAHGDGILEECQTRILTVAFVLILGASWSCLPSARPDTAQQPLAIPVFAQVKSATLSMTGKDKPRC